jgi:hypothetical protein
MTADIAIVADSVTNIDIVATNIDTISEKVNKAGDTMTGHLEVPAGASANQVPRASETVLKAGSAQVMSVDLTVPSLNGGQLSGQRRKNLNGDCVIAQTGTSFVIPANSSTFTLDGWEAACAGAAAITVTQSTDVPAGGEFQFSHRVTINTADTGIAASDYVGVWARVEGYDARDLVGVPIAISFLVRSAKTGVHGIGIQSIGPDRSYVATYTVNVANVWEKKTVPIPTGLITAGTWNWTDSVGFWVSFALAAGSDYRATAGSWLNGNYWATSAQVNVADTVGNVFAITGLQIARGTVYTPYEHRSYASELRWAQRYLRPNGCLVGVSTSTTRINGIAVDFSGNPMRVPPSLILVNGTAAAHDVSTAFRNISSPIFSGNVNGGYVDTTCTTTTNNKVHNILPGTFLFDSRI